MDDLDKLLGRSAELADAIADELQTMDFPVDSRGTATLGLCDVSFEHAEALKSLMADGLPTSAVAMLRLQYESLVRAAWLLHVASDYQIARLLAPLTIESQQAAKNLPSVVKMLDELNKRGPIGAGPLLSRFRERQGDSLNSFVHGGIHALQRKAGGYPCVLLMDILKSSNAVLMLTFLVSIELCGDVMKAASMSALNRTFADCLPEIEPFPVA